MNGITQLAAHVSDGRLTGSDAEFARSLISQFNRKNDLSPRQWPYVQKLIDKVEKPAPAAAAVGDLSGILALFDRARQNLKYPAIVLSVPEVDETIRINVAGAQARVPGSLNVTAAERPGNPGERREWYGRITTDGVYQPSRDCRISVAALTARLREFAADPVRVAGDHGTLTGHCCFCNKGLRDPRSTAVGYGSTCAKNFGLPWGAREARVVLNYVLEGLGETA